MATKTSAKTAKKTAPKSVGEKKINVLFVTPEAFPFAGTGGLGDVCGSLPRAINSQQDVAASVILPLYEEVPYRFREKMEFVTNITVQLAWRNQYCGLFKLNYEGVTYYFIDNEYYFKRGKVYGYFDDGERFAFFSRATLAVLPYLDVMPNILVANDHTTGLVPVYYKLQFAKIKGYENIKTMFTIHNLEYQGVYSKDILDDVLGLDESALPVLEFNGNLNCAKGAITACDKLITVSPQYAKEIRLPENAHGLDGILIENRSKLVGILNGIDIEDYNPATDKALFKNFDVNSVSDKIVNKLELQRMLKLPQDPDIPMIGMVTRMAKHKGLDLVRRAINETLPGSNVLASNVQIVMLGRGDADYEGYFTHIQNTYDKRVRTIITFNKDLAQKIYAASDIYLMPSKSEPCGLSQMIACRYGAVPVVRATGGLADSIIDFDKDGAHGNGFVFEEYDAVAMDDAITRATTQYYFHKDNWNRIVHNAMTSDFSWNVSARKYAELFKDALK